MNQNLAWSGHSQPYKPSTPEFRTAEQRGKDWEESLGWLPCFHFRSIGRLRFLTTTVPNMPLIRKIAQHISSVESLEWMKKAQSIEPEMQKLFPEHVGPSWKLYKGGANELDFLQVKGNKFFKVLFLFWQIRLHCRHFQKCLICD